MNLAVFDSGLRANFSPVSLTHATFDMTFGTGTLLSSIEERVGAKAANLFVPDYLQDLTQEYHMEMKVNSAVSRKCLIVNSLISRRSDMWHYVNQASFEDAERLFFDSYGNLVFGFMDGISSPEEMRKMKMSSDKSRNLPPEINETALMRFPWKLVDENSIAIEEDFSRKSKDKSNIELRCESRGSKFRISSLADIERFVTLDSRKGPVIIEDGSHVQSFSHLTGPCFIGRGTIVKSAKIREGTSVGEFCRVAGEIEASLLGNYTNKNHEGFVGHSIIGSWVNIGALTTNSDLKNTYGEIKANVKGKQVRTGSIKVGTYIGDMAKTGIGCMINSGKSIGVSSHALGSVSDDVPSFSIYLGAKTKAFEMYLDSAIETQRRMMSRRGITISDRYMSMMKKVFKMTMRDRAEHRILKGKFKY